MSEFAAEIQNALVNAQKMMVEASRFLDAAVGKLLGNQQDQSSEFSCDSCPEKRNGCKKLCVKVKKMLPGIEAGRGHKELRTGIGSEQERRWNHSENQYETIRNLNANRRSGFFGKFEKYPEIFTEKQWAAVELRFREGKTQAEIAQHLGIRRNSVSELLGRAQQKLEQHCRKLRANNHDSPSD